MKKLLLCLLFVFLLGACSSSGDDDDDNNDSSDPVTKDFYVWDLSVMPPSTKIVTATLQAEGSFSYVFVDNEEWNVTVNASQATELVSWFEEKTPTGSIDSTQ